MTGLFRPGSQIRRYAAVCAPMMVFVSKATLVATGGRLVKMLRVFVDNTCQILLADKMGSFCMAVGFGKLSTKKLPNI